MRFEGKVAVITGGGGGLGTAFARALSVEGARTVLLDVDEAAAVAAAAALIEQGFESLGLCCNVTDEHQVDRVMQQAYDHFGRLDILVNNAALHRRKYNQPFGTLPRDEVRALFDVNVMGIVNCSIACQPLMVAGGGGVIVNIASTSSNASRTPYGVSKLAARGVTVALAAELGPHNIRVNAISPGFVGSAGTLAEYQPENLLAILAALGVPLPAEVVAKCTTEDLADMIRARHLVSREGTVDDVVKALLYLCSDDAAFVAGETLAIAGGSSVAF